MKVFSRIILIIAAAIFLTGCNKNNNVPSGVVPQKTNLPPELTGTWIAGEGNWKIVFAPDGKLSSIEFFFNMTAMKVDEGGGYDFYEDGKLRSYYIFGPIDINYYEPNNVLTMNIKIDQYWILRPMGEFSGSMDHTFTVKLSADKKTWNVHWECKTKIDQFDESSIDKNDLIFTKEEK